MKVYLTEKIHPDALAFLESHGEVVQGEATDEASIIRQAAGCDAVLVRVAKITAAILDGVPTIKAVAKHGIGVDNIDVEAATQRGVQVLNAPLSNVNAVAEHALALLLALAKNIALLDYETRRGGFSRRSQYVNLELAGRTVGLIGFGKIAQRFAKQLSGLEMRVIASDPYGDAEAAKRLGVTLVTQEELLRKADFVSLHTPLLEETHKMIDAAALAQMKPTACLINVARGPVVDERALCDALRDGVIAGAALDVYDPEPPAADNPLFSLENVVLSPHNAALSDQALLAMAMDSATGIVDFLEGRAPLYPVNKPAK